MFKGLQRYVTMGKLHVRPAANLLWFAGALGHEYADALATGVCGLRAGIIYPDIAVEVGHTFEYQAVQLDQDVIVFEYTIAL